MCINRDENGRVKRGVLIFALIYFNYENYFGSWETMIMPDDFTPNIVLISGGKVDEFSDGCGC